MLLGKSFLDTCRLIAAIVVVLVAAAAYRFTSGPHSDDFSTRRRNRLGLDRLGVEKIVVITLPRAANRTKALLQQAETLGLHVDLLNASDGVFDTQFRSPVLPSYRPESTCSDVIGAIFESHERAWTSAVNDSRPTLVLEDDVLLPEEFVTLFRERVKELPDNYDVAFVGTSVTPKAPRFSSHLSRPDEHDPNLQALLGFWGYLVTPSGAGRLLQMAAKARRRNRRNFQPVDLFIAHRIKRLKVYVFEPPADLSRWFQENPDRHHVLETMRQVGILKIAQVPTTNKGVDDDESKHLSSAMQQVVKLGGGEKYTQAWKVADDGFKRMRKFSCFSAATFLQNSGLTLLRILQTKSDGLKKRGAKRTLLLALEALASSVRYTEGTYQERTKKRDFPQWVQQALNTRRANGFAAVAPENGWDSPVDLGNNVSFNPKTFDFFEPLSQAATALRKSWHLASMVQAD